MLLPRVRRRRDRRRGRGVGPGHPARKVRRGDRQREDAQDAAAARADHQAVGDGAIADHRSPGDVRDESRAIRRRRRRRARGVHRRNGRIVRSAGRQRRRLADPEHGLDERERLRGREGGALVAIIAVPSTEKAIGPIGPGERDEARASRPANGEANAPRCPRSGPHKCRWALPAVRDVGDAVDGGNRRAAPRD